MAYEAVELRVAYEAAELRVAYEAAELGMAYEAADVRAATGRDRRGTPDRAGPGRLRRRGATRRRSCRGYKAAEVPAACAGR